MRLKGFGIGHADDQRLKSGVTVILPDRPATAAVHVMGGAPGTRETDLLSPEQLVQTIDAIVLSGGSAFTRTKQRLPCGRNTRTYCSIGHMF